MTSYAAAIIPAAGSGTRMKAVIPKQFLSLAGKPVLAHTVSAFAGCSCISQIIVVVPKDRISETEKMLVQHQLDKNNIHVVAGGLRRQDSVCAGLAAVEKHIDIVMVHDGARPLISNELIERCYHETTKTGAAIAAVPVKDTLKREFPKNVVATTVDRNSLWQAQTPQGARKELLIKAFDAGKNCAVTDESSLLENAGIPVHFVYGETTNIKITSPEDLEYAEKLMNTRQTSLRIGHGFDAHRFAADRKLILGGEEISHSLGLAGHSDADVLTHALCDAVLGALGEGDIGHHFPDSDDAYKGICSTSLLDNIIALADTKKFGVVNADVTIICQAPKLASYIDKIRENLAACCKTDIGRINIKATTTEKMGFTGREEGISCHAVVLLDHINNV